MALTRTMLREQIKEVLLARILEGDYAPGARIVEMQVAQEFGTSQAPVREALRELEALRLIVSEPHRGARVRKVTARELAEIYPVRAALEEEAARAAASRLGGRVEALEAEYAAMRAAADREDVHDLVAHDVAFHRVIVEGSGNQTLLEIWASLHVASRTVITLVKERPDLHAVAEMHRPLIEAFRTRNPARCARMVRKHIEHFAKWVPKELDAIDDDGSPAAPAGAPTPAAPPVPVPPAAAPAPRPAGARSRRSAA
jgi:DNA-binding GntR family transcriptional regulator